MKIIETTVYTAQELKEQFPFAFNRALEHYQQNNCHEIAWQDETIASLKACLKAAGVTLRNWSLGAYDRGNFIRIVFQGNEDTEELSGKRAFAWLENNLFGPLRISYTARDRWKLAKHNGDYHPRADYYTAGKVPPCPLTGYCADDEYLDALKKDIRQGCTLKEAFRGLAGVCARLLESEVEAQMSEEYFLETAERNEWQFTKDGELF